MAVTPATGTGADGSALLNSAFPRLEQTFPTLTPQEIARMRRFGDVRHYKHGEMLFETGKPGPGMFVVLSGHVAITQRDGLGHVTPVIDQGPGQFLAEIGQLSGRIALVDGHAEGDVETLLIPPERLRALLVAEADLGERIMRALILRRVSLIQGGVGGPVLIGPQDSSGVIRLQSFLTRNGIPHHLLDKDRDSDAAELIARYSPSPSDWPLVVMVDGTVLRNPIESELARALGMIGGSGRRQGLRCRHRRLRSGGACDRGLRRLGRPLGGGAGRARLRRPGRRQRKNRELSRLPYGNFGPGAGRPRLHPGAEVRRRHHDSGGREGARLQPPRRRLCADARRRRAAARAFRGGRERRALPAAGDRKSRSFRGPRCLVLGLADRGAAVRGAGGRPGRRRQFRRPGRGVSVRPRPQDLHDHSRRRPRRQHVALSDRAHRGHPEHRTDIQHRGGRAGRHARTVPSSACAGAAVSAAKIT